MEVGPIYFTATEEGFTLNLLDKLLAAGYYRMQHLIFTTHVIFENDQHQSIPVFWLRTRVGAVSATKNSAKIRQKCKNFSVEIKDAILTQEIETLYRLYKNSISFTVSNNCWEYLHQPEIPLPYHSKMIEVRDGKLLVAVGFFDVGKNSLAGILNFYHPNYKKYSLGKFLMLQKIDYALKQHLSLYYTGYFSTAYEKFNYKIFPNASAIEIFLPKEKCWVPYQSMSTEQLNIYAEKNFQFPQKKVN